MNWNDLGQRLHWVDQAGPYRSPLDVGHLIGIPGELNSCLRRERLALFQSHHGWGSPTDFNVKISALHGSDMVIYDSSYQITYDKITFGNPCFSQIIITFYVIIHNLFK